MANTLKKKEGWVLSILLYPYRKLDTHIEYLDVVYGREVADNFVRRAGRITGILIVLLVFLLMQI